LKNFFYIFFCFYFIALTAKPCADKANCNEFKQTEMSKHDHQEKHADEICTPMCVCACCATNVVINDYPSTIIELTEMKTVYRVQKDSKISSITLSIWQPPKLA